MGNERVFADTGPLIHLSEIEAITALDIFKVIHIPELVVDELTIRDLPGYDIIKRDQFRLVKIIKGCEELSKEMINSHSMGKNDAMILAITLQNMGTVILTDDLEVRGIAQIYEIQPVGTIGILLRAFREDILTLDELLEKLGMVIDRSTLFITRDLIDEVIEAAEKYARSRV